MSVRRKALEALMDITDRGAYANLRLKEALEGMDERDAKWVSALVYTALDRLNYIDYVLETHARGRVHASIRGILRMGVCQALFMDVPESAACDESVKLTKEIGKGALSGYVNAVMRSVCRAKDNPLDLPQDLAARLSVEFSFPLFLVREYIARYGEAFAKDMLSCRGRGITLRAQYPFTEDELERELAARGLAFTRGKIVESAFRLERGLDVTKLELFLSGKLAVQSEGAMLACIATGAREGDRVLDACAAPGGKTAFLASLTRNKAAITAWELREHRAALAAKTLARLHVENASVAVRDASIVDTALLSSMDAVLVDAPCSALGLWGKPDAKQNKEEQTVTRLAALQKSILDACAPYVKPGGTLVYSTCTVSHAENEAQVEAFLKAHAEFSLSSLAKYVPERLKERGKTGMLQLFPHLDGVEGFFVARMVRHG
ncbi:MAG: 16S rRNA (cytosine(967)-C(5))-methyltransferase RsmB [Clostridiaceae bacterium]|nr:16S rRNA (cytosine(967)-C(5))-methyltransferase RsmB [Eubacteriales bacterium]